MYDSIYIKFKNRKTQAVVKIIKIVISSGEKLISKSTNEHSGIMEIAFTLIGIWNTQIY